MSKERVFARLPVDPLFSWLGPLLRAGRKNKLSADDLLEMPTGDKTAVLLEEFLQMRKQGLSVGAAFIRQNASEFVGAGIFMMLWVSAQLLTPIVFRWLIEAVEDRYSGGTILWLAIGLFACTLTGGIANQLQLHFSFHVGQRLRSTTIALVFRKALTVAPSAALADGGGYGSGSSRTADQGRGGGGGKRGRSSAFASVSVINILSTDTTQFLICLPLLNQVWAAPAQIMLATYFLFDLLGYAALVGIFILALMAPVSWWINDAMQRCRTRQMEVSDRRVKLCSEVLAGIRVVKYMSWEKKFTRQILTLREKELFYIKRFTFLFASSLYCLLVLPVFAVAASIAVFVVIGGDLTASRAFTAVAFFSVLRFPLMQLGSVLTSLVQVLIAVKRIQVFLDRPDRRPVPMLKDMATSPGDPYADQQPLIAFNQASFDWSVSGGAPQPTDSKGGKRRGEEGMVKAGIGRGSKNFDRDGTLSKVQMKLMRGSFVAVVGPVGSGKSSLLQALLGDVPLTGGSYGVRRETKMTYVPQTAWILNASVKDNILFGSEMDQCRYLRVLEACQLHSDLRQLPAGDRTMIGERGITMSGGQKQRISLARAVNSDRDVFLLDDPFSALDAHTGSAVFDALLGPQGLLRRDQTKAVLLVTNQFQYTEGSDFVLVLTENGHMAYSGSRQGLVESQKPAVVNLLKELQDLQRPSHPHPHLQQQKPSPDPHDTTGNKGDHTPLLIPSKKDHHDSTPTMIETSSYSPVRNASTAATSPTSPYPTEEALDGLSIAASRVVIDELPDVHELGVGVGVGDDCGLGTGIEDDEQMWVKSVAVKMANEAADGLFGISTPRRAEPEREHEGEPEGGASCSTSEAAVALEVHIDQPREMARDDGKHQEPDESPGGGKRSHRQPSDDNAATAASSAAEQADRAIPIAFPVTLPKEAVPSLSLIRTSTFSKYLRGHYKGQRSFTEVCRSILGAGKGQADSWKKSRRRESEKPAVVSDGGDDVEGGDQLMEEESRESGEVSWGVISRYLAAAGGITWVISITVALILERASYVGSDIWLAHWTREDPIASDVNIYLAIYCAIFASNAVVVFIRTSLFALFTIRASRHMFRKLLQSCLRCPQSFFDTTPIGRIVNRFSYDTETADVTLVTKMIPFVASLFWLTAGVLVLLVVLWPWMLLVMAPMAFFYWQLLQYSRSSIRDLQRLDSVSRSPLQSHVAESLDGLQCLRAYGCGERFAVRCDEHTDNNTRAVFCFNSANRWLGVRVESIGAIISLGAAVLIWIVREDLTGGLVGLVLVWVLNLSVSTNYLCIYTPQFEAAMTSVERIDEYSQLPEEPCYNQPTDKTTTAPTGWPSNGAIEFRGTCLRYRPGLPRALRGLWLSIEGGERVALVGRTGAGKSSVAVALFRLVEPWSELGEGSGILVDGVDIGTLRREDVRGRHGGICIITQDPIIFSGTVRSNLDPFDQHSDEDVWRALSRARLDKLVRAHTAMLAMPVQEGGSNFSLGERQLLCLARALLCRPKVLVMDEATASVDRATDDFVQHTVRAAFRDCTLLTIAHRLQTIADYDKVVVMDAGRVVEVGAPYDLLTAPREHEFNKRPGSFLRLVQSCGPHVAMQILTTAAEAKLLRERRWGDHHSGTKGHFLTS
ncbi:unnamed protein product [Vitrella brassicaformis CCMP3155]|uniref:Uncharacterized protein n=4 Tax=Vitrella brassicaformis TaxID=1169539 RepID=A0A0G4FWI6_VITBC|nr:unnamed protein product [Vitrella brassicaformis CCMP3155]|eukprot:CEM19582.1 unnamed protein product [Vitrella brassicaformis CCMP3155]